MNFKSTIILLLLLIGVGSYLAWDHFHNGEEKPETQTDMTGEGHKLFDVDAKDINRLMIKPADGAQITLVKDAGNWRFTEPVVASADATAVQDFAASLAALRAHGEEDLTDANRASFGLDKPKYQVEMSAGTGKLLRFNVGIKGALGDVTYVEVAGTQKVQSAPSEVYDKLNQSIDTIRDKRLVTVPSQDIKQITLTTPSAKIVVKKFDGAWRVVEPLTIPADASAMTDLCGAIVGLQAQAFYRNDSKQAGMAKLDQPTLTVAFSTEAPITHPLPATGAAPATQPASTTITFGAYAGLDSVYASVSGTNEIVTVPQQSLMTLTKRPSELRDRNVVDVDPDHVMRIEMSRMSATTQPTSEPVAVEAPITLQRLPAPAPESTQPAPRNPPEPAWALYGGMGGRASPAAVKALLAAVHPLKVLNYVDSAPSAAPTINRVLKLTMADGSTNMVVIHEYPAGQTHLGEYNGLLFQADGSLESAMSASFKWVPDFLEAKLAPKKTGPSPSPTVH